MRGECSEKFLCASKPVWFGLVILIARLLQSACSEFLIYKCFRFIFDYIVKNTFVDNYIQGLRWDYMVANNLCKIIYINILNYNIYFKDKLILDVAEAPKPGQLKELGEASDDELVEVQEPAIEVLEQCEFEEEDVGLEEIDQDKLEVVETACIDLMLLGKISTFVKD